MEGGMRLSPSSVALRAGLLLASLLVSTILLEVALRVVAIDVASYHSIQGFAVYDPVLGWRLAPSRDAVFRGAHFAVRVHQNAEGLRDRHYDYARTPDRRRVLVLGDSVVWCWGVEQDECFTERLERALADTDVINAGVPGYSTAQELLFYEREGRRYAPDVVVLVVAPNDVADNLDQRGPRFRLDGGELRHEPAPPPRRKSAATEWLQEHSRLFAFGAYVGTVFGRTFRRPDDERPPSAPAFAADAATTASAPRPAATPASWALAEALFDCLQRAVQADGARLVVVLEETPEPQRAWLQSFWSERAVPVLDVAPPLAAAAERGERVRLDGDPHLGPAGQAVVAAELARLVAPELARLDSARRP
jgi:lysophospholipase L1-like esterase